MWERNEPNNNKSIIRRSEVGRKAPLTHSYIQAINDASKALTKNGNRIREIEKKYGIGSFNK
jgi:hypothetical protein